MCKFMKSLLSVIAFFSAVAATSLAVIYLLKRRRMLSDLVRDCSDSFEDEPVVCAKEESRMKRLSRYSKDMLERNYTKMPFHEA